MEPQGPTRLRLVVTVGVELGRAWELARGELRHVGSGAAADVVVTGDELVGGMHCAVWWNGEQCRVRDVGAGGTWLNGRGVVDEALTDGDVVQVGRTQLRVEFVGGEVGGVVDESREVDPKAEALRVLRGLPGRLYAVLDAARDPEVLQLLRRSGYRYECLYSGWAAEVYGDVAPYLVQLRKEGRLLEQLVERGWGKGWGVYGSTNVSTERLRILLRKKIQVEAAFHGRVMFRFFDPDILDVFVMSSSNEELRAFLKGMGALAFESGSMVRVLTRPGRRHEKQTIIIATTQRQGGQLC